MRFTCAAEQKSQEVFPMLTGLLGFIFMSCLASWLLYNGRQKIANADKHDTQGIEIFDRLVGRYMVILGYLGFGMSLLMLITGICKGS